MSVPTQGEGKIRLWGVFQAAARGACSHAMVCGTGKLPGQQPGGEGRREGGMVQ